MSEPTIQEYIESVTEAKVKAGMLALSLRILNIENEIGQIKTDLIELEARVATLEI